MLIVAFALLSATVAIGSLLLMPRRIGKRGTIAAMHGLLGLSGVAILLMASKSGQGLWAAFALLGGGLLAGATLFFTTRHKTPPGALALALHIILAGMGYLLLAGLILG